VHKIKPSGGAMRKGAVALAIPLLALSSQALGAPPEELQQEVEFLKKRLAEVERELKESRKEKAELPKISFGGNGVLYYQGAKWGSEGPSGTGLVANLELSVEPVKGGELYARLHAGEGEGADKELADYLFANLNTLADDNPDTDTFRLLEFYYRQELLNGSLTLFVGKTEPFILIDSNEFANDEVSQFVGKPFVNNPIIDPEDRFAPMVAFDWKVADSLSLQGVFQSSNKGELYWDGQEWTNEEKSSYSDPFDRPTLALQGTYSTDGGNYRLYLWADTAPHPKVDQVEDPTKEPNSVKGVAVGISFDRKITEKLGVFGRVALGRKTAYPDYQFYSLGFNLSSPFSSRPNDAFAFGAAAIVPSPLYSKQSTEVHFEGYYKAAFSDNLFLTPDLQVVLNPGGDGSADPVYAFTLKLEVSF